MNSSPGQRKHKKRAGVFGALAARVRSLRTDYRREGEAPAEPSDARDLQLGRSLALPENKPLIHGLTALLLTTTALTTGCQSQPPTTQPDPAMDAELDAELEQALSDFEIGAAQRERELQDQREALD